MNFVLNGQENKGQMELHVSWYNSKYYTARRMRLSQEADELR